MAREQNRSKGVDYVQRKTTIRIIGNWDKT